jgi:hypothetical protein
MYQVSSAVAARHPKVLLPVVERAILQLNEIFMEHFGAAGSALAQEVFYQWVKSGKTGPSGLPQYAYALGVQLDDPKDRRKFTEQAEHLLLQLRSGFVS